MAPPLASITTPVQNFPPALLAPPHFRVNQIVPTQNEIQELKALYQNMANHITLLSRQNNGRRYPYPIVDRAQNQQVITNNIDLTSTFG